MTAIQRGETIKQKVRFINTQADTTPRATTTKPNPFDKCCLTFPAFAEIGGTDPLRNDFKSPIRFYPVTATVSIFLQKENSAGIFEDVATLDDDTLGTAYDLREKDNIKPYGYRLEWSKVLEFHGAGCYRFKFDDSVEAINSPEQYHLRPFDECLADGTTRFTTTRNSVIGTNNQRVKFDFVGLEWEDQFRIPESKFGERSAGQVTETVLLNSGRQRPYKKEFQETYRLECRKIDKLMMDVLLYDFKQNDFMTVTDYNLDNFDNRFNEIAVEAEGDFSPAYGRDAPTTAVVMEFKDAFDNRKKHFS